MPRLSWLLWLPLAAVALAATVAVAVLLARRDERAVLLASFAFFAGMAAVDFRPWKRGKQ